MIETGRQKNIATFLTKIVSSLPTDRPYTETEALIDLAYRQFNHKAANVELLAADWDWNRRIVALVLDIRGISLKTDKVSQWVNG